MRLFNKKEGDFSITPATDEDIGLCVDMISKAMGGRPINKEILEQTLKTPNMIVLVAKTKEKIVGIISGLAFPTMIPPPRIDFLSVSDEESARKGLYGILIDEFIEELKKRLPNAKYVDTNVPAINPQFTAVYSFKGFVVTGFIKGEQSMSDVVVLRKILAKDTSKNFTV